MFMHSSTNHSTLSSLPPFLLTHYFSLQFGNLPSLMLGNSHVWENKLLEELHAC